MHGLPLVLQLSLPTKLDSYDGADRGATKKAVYDASRLKTMEPTRLFTDAKNSTEWRKKAFFSMTESTVGDGFNDSMMLYLLDHKRKNPKSSGSYYPEADDLTCSKNGSELAEYLEKHPNNGMPFGFPPLKQEEFDLVAGWLYQGAKGPTPAEQRVLEASKPEDAAEVGEFVEHLITSEINKKTAITFDKINYIKSGEDYPAIPRKHESRDDYLQGFRAVSRPGTPFVALVNDHNANLAYMRIRLKNGKDFAATLVVNRWHNNVAFMLMEEKRLNPLKDNIEFIPGMIGSYPNLFFDIHQDDIPNFINLINFFDASKTSVARLAKYGINRSDDRFWETYDWFQKRLNEDEPVTGGLLDLNRYFHKAN